VIRFPAAALLLLLASPLPKEGAKEGGKQAPKPEEAKEQFQDSITLKGVRNPVTGVEVVSETWEKVEWKAKSGPVQNRPASEVTVKYGNEPPDFTKGQAAFLSGRWEDAEAQFRGVRSGVDAGRFRKFWASRAAAYIGQCRLQSARKARDAAKFALAAESFKEAMTAEPKSPLSDIVHVGLADALAGAGKTDEALAALDAFRKAASDAGKPVWESRARLARGRILEGKGEVGGAAQEYAELANFVQNAAPKVPADSPDRRELEAYRIRGLVGQGWALYSRAEKTKAPADVEAAKKHFAGLPAATGGDVAGRAAALNGEGGLLLLEGKASEALEKFVQVEVTMFAVPEEVCRALWYKSQACDRLGNGAGREQAIKDLQEFYPWSEWANRAR